MDDCRISQSQSSILLMVQYLMSLDTGGLSPADSSLCYIQSGFGMMYSAFKLNKQSDNIQP